MEALEAAGFDLSLRAEDLTIKQFCRLTRLMVETGALEPGKIRSPTPFKSYSK